MERLYECRRSSKRAGHSPLARLADHIPDPGKHRNHFYAHYANRVRGERPSDLGLSPPEKPPPEVREIVRVPVNDEGRQIGANPA